MKIAKPRRTMKTWTYNQITEHTEAQIKQAMQHREGAEPNMQLLWWAQAHGLYTSWDRLTMGWQNDGDAKRLEALTKTPE